MNEQLKQEILKIEKLIDKKIEDFNKSNWEFISIYQKLSEDFIERFKDNVDWSWISTKQKLSEEFIEKFEDRVDWDYILENQNLFEKFKNKYLNNEQFEIVD